MQRTSVGRGATPASRAAILGLALAAGAALGGCGQKGPLFLGATPGAAASSPQAAMPPLPPPVRP